MDEFTQINFLESGMQGLVISLIKKGHIAFGGNRQLKIYGRLNCGSGKRMKIKNRVFFTTEQEAFAAGYRPCGHCMKDKYKEWKKKPHPQPFSKKEGLRAFERYCFSEKYFQFTTKKF